MTQPTKTFDRPDFTDRRGNDNAGAQATELRARAGMWRAIRAAVWLTVWIVLAPLLLAGALGVGLLAGMLIRGAS